MSIDTSLTRAEFLRSALAVGALSSLAPSALAGSLVGQAKDETPISLEDLAGYEKVAGVAFADDQRKAAIAEVRQARLGLDRLDVPYSLVPALGLKLIGEDGAESNKVDVPLRSARIEVPSSDEDLVFLTVVELSHLIRTRKVSCVRLMRAYWDRLQRLNEKLNCVVNFNTMAMKEALLADREIERGKWRGPLHGIPYGLKDLFATKGIPTTWGAEPFREQMIDDNATVVEKLHAAGAILIAKLSVGALAMDDKWFGGQTKNPWNLSVGSSGSSAGSASATAAGCCAFAIGTETLGSIMSPSQRCRITGLRPTFGRVSRAGCMALSWSMDKAGVISRTAEDALLVLAAIVGKDERDPDSVNRALVAKKKFDPKKLKIGYLQGGQPLDENDKSLPTWLKSVESLGLEMKPVEISMPNPVTLEGLSVEGAAVFDQLVKTGAIDQLTYSAWPAIFRASRYVSGVDYLQGVRERYRAMQKFHQEMGDLDLIFAPDRGAQALFITNLSGHPQLYVPMGGGMGFSIIGRHFGEADMCAMAWLIQQKSEFYRQRPPL